MAKKAHKSHKSKKGRKTNVYMRSFEVAERGAEAVVSSTAASSARRAQRQGLVRSQIYGNTLPQELRRMGVITAGAAVTLTVLAVVLNLV